MRLSKLMPMFITLVLGPSVSHAIDLNFTYVDSGLAPAADSDGSRLMNLFDFAEAFYEDVFEDTDFTSNIDVSYANLPGLLGLYTTAVNTIQIQRTPNVNWFIDDTPADNSEFTLVQSQWRDLSAAEKANGFNFSDASSVPATFEVGFNGTNGPTETVDMLTTVMHEVGHALGVVSTSITETFDFDYDFDSDWLFGADLAARTQGLDLGHLEHPEALMNIGDVALRVFPSHTDLFSMAAALGFDELDIPRREFYGGSNWTIGGNWTGNRRPGADDEAFVRLASATVSINSVAGTLHVHEGAGVILSAGVKLDLDNNNDADNPKLGDVELLDLNSFIRIHQGGELEARDVWLGSNTTVDLRGGFIDATSLLTRSNSTLSSTGPNAALVVVDTFENDGTLLVDGGDLTVDAANSFLNDGLIRVVNGSTLTLQSANEAPWQLDPLNSGAALKIDVDGGHFEVVSGELAHSYDSIMRIANGASVDISEPWELASTSGPNGELRFEGSGGLLTGGHLTMRGRLEVVEGVAEIDAPLTASSAFTAPGLITVRSGAVLQQDGDFIQGAGDFVVESGAEATFNDSVELTQNASGVIDGAMIFNDQLLFLSDDYTGTGRHVHNEKSTLGSSADVTIGTVQVGGAGILLIDAASLSSAALQVRGQADIVNKGTWNNAATALVNSDSGFPAEVTVDSFGEWTIGGNLTIGSFTNNGSGRVVLTDGLVEVTAQTGIAPQSSLHVDGGVFTSGVLSMSSGANFEQTGGDVSVGEFNKQGGATFSFSGGSFEIDGGFGTFNSALAFGGTESNQPTFRVVNGADVTVTSNWHIGSAAGTFAKTVVRGPGSTLRSTGVNPGADLYVGRFGAGTLIVEDGGLADFGDDFELARDGVDSTGVATVRGVSNVAGSVVRSEVRVTRNGTGAALTVGRLGDGELNIESGALVAVGGVVSVGTNPDSTGLVNIVGSSDGFPAELDAPDSVVRVGATTGSGNNAILNVFTGGLLNADRLEVRQRGIANLSGGEMRLDLLDLSNAQAFNMSDGLLDVLTVNGQLAPTGGVVAPRGVAGVLVINGFYEPTADAVLEIDIDGNTMSDLVAIDGVATLGGELRVLLGSSYAPVLGDGFDILIANSITGTFDTVTLPELSGNLDWGVTYSATAVTLDVVTSVLPGDFDGDGDVDGFDFLTWQRDPSIGSLADWEASYGASASENFAALAEYAVPEPSALVLASLCLLSAQYIRRARPLRRTW